MEQWHGLVPFKSTRTFFMKQINTKDAEEKMCLSFFLKLNPNTIHCCLWFGEVLDCCREFYRKIIITKDLKVIFNLVCCLLSTKSKRNASLHLCEFKIKFLIWHKKPDILLKFACKIKSSSSTKSSLFCFFWYKGCSWVETKKKTCCGKVFSQN